MAIFNINNSTLNEYFNEHGGLRNKIYKNRKDARENDKKLEERYDKVYKNASDVQKRKIADMFKKDSIKSLNRVQKAEKEADKLENAINSHFNKPNQSVSEAIRKGTTKYLDQKKNEHIERGINSDKKTVDLSKKEPNQYKKLADSRKKLKEATEYILAVLDEIEK